MERIWELESWGSGDTKCPLVSSRGNRCCNPAACGAKYCLLMYSSWKYRSHEARLGSFRSCLDGKESNPTSDQVASRQIVQVGKRLAGEMRVKAVDF